MLHQPLPPLHFRADHLERLCAAIRGTVERIALPPTTEDAPWRPRPDAPELLLVLLRSAELPFEVFQEVAQRLDVPLPPILLAHIGREMWGRFGHPEAGSIVFLYGAPDEETIEEATRSYEAWLRQDAYAQQIMQQMRASVPEPDTVKRVLIIDDCEHEGSTALSARLLVGQAFGAAAGSELAFLPFSLQAIADAFEADLQAHLPTTHKPTHAQTFLYNLVRGYVETGTSCEPIRTANDLRLIGEKCVKDWVYHFHRYQGHDPGPLAPSPYPVLSSLYGDAALMTLRERYLDALRSAVLEREACAGSPSGR